MSATKLKICFIGCLESSKQLLKKTLDIPEAEVIAVVTREKSTFNSDFCCLSEIAKDLKIPYIYYRKSCNNRLVEFIRKYKADIIYCFGWPFLLDKEVLSATKLGAIGFHPTALPMNRGRHPIIWTLVLGIKETASTFFFMDEGADTGDILNSRQILVKSNDDASSLYSRILKVGCKQLMELTQNLASGDYSCVPQDKSNANSWRKREHIDGRIDWRMTAGSIYNLVRGLTKPYVGAHFIFRGNEIKVWKVSVVKNKKINIEPGKVISVCKGVINVKAGEDAVCLLNIEPGIKIESGIYL